MIKKSICNVLFLIFVFMMMVPSGYGLSTWQFLVMAVGILGVYTIGRYEVSNGL